MHAAVYRFDLRQKGTKGFDNSVFIDCAHIMHVNCAFCPSRILRLMDRAS